MLHEDRERAGSFGADADRYDRARPSYPSALVDDLLAGGARDVLDVGCGTGIASRLFASRSVRVLGVEPDERMAAVARREGTNVEIATFEQWDPLGRRFDLLISAQAWHWVDPWRGASKAAEVLRPDGRLGLFWNIVSYEERQRAVVERVYSESAPGFGAESVLLGARDDRAPLAADALRGAGAFTDVVTRTYAWRRAYPRAEWLDQLPTHSEYRALAPGARRQLLAAIGEAIDGFGGALDVRYTTLLVTASACGGK